MLSNKDYKMLHLNAQGYVLKCLCCDHYQLAFGTSLLIFSQQELYDFWQMVQRQISYSGEVDNPQLKQFQLPTVTPKVILVFNLRELQELEYLLKQAHFRLEIVTLMQNIDLN